MCQFARWAVVCAAVAGTACPALAQTTYTWNNATADWGDAAAWTPGGPPSQADTALFDLYAGGVPLPVTSFSGNQAVGQVRYRGPLGSAEFVWNGNGNTLAVGTGGAMTAAPFTARQQFGTNLVLDNLTVTVAAGTSFAAGSTAAGVGAFDLSGQAGRVTLRNGSDLLLGSGSGSAALNRAASITTGSTLTLGAGSALDLGVLNPASRQQGFQFQGGGQLAFQGANTTGSADVTTTFNANGVMAQSGSAVVSVFTGFPQAGATGVPRTVVSLGVGTAQAGAERFVRSPATGQIVGVGQGGTLTLNLPGSIPGGGAATVPSGRVSFAPGGGTNGPGGPAASFVVTQNGTITDNNDSPYVLLTGRVNSGEYLGSRFAGYNTGTGEVVAAATTLWTEADVAGTAPPAGPNVVYAAAAMTAAALGASQTFNTFVIEPVATGAGGGLDLAGRVLATNGLALSTGGRSSVSTSYTLSGGTITGTGGPSYLNVYVQSPGLATNFLNVSSRFDRGTGGILAVAKFGPGVLNFTGTADQFAADLFAGTAADLALNEGSVRVRLDGATANFGSLNTLRIRGGTLEVDTAGRTVNFTRTLGNGYGQVNWSLPVPGGGQDFADRGSGGVVGVGTGGTLRINIGGDGRQLVWGGTTGGNQFFLRGNNTLWLGNGRATGVTELVNSLALDDGSAGLPADSRQVFVLAPTAAGASLDPANRKVISGVISGTAATQLVVNGNGTLQLTAANTYAGGTAVDGTVLQVNNTAGSATGTGPVLVSRILLGSGTIAPAAGNGVTVRPAASIIADSRLGTPGQLTIGADGVNNPLLLQPQANFGSRLQGTTVDPAGGVVQYGRLQVRGTGTITLDPLAQLAVQPEGGFTPAAVDRFLILDNRTPNPIGGVFANAAAGTYTVTDLNRNPTGRFDVTYTGNLNPDGSIGLSGGNDLVLYNFVPVPEPGLLLAAAAGGLWAARRGRRVVESR